MTTDATRFKNRFLLVLALGISLLFLAMIRQFLVAILLAAVFSAMCRPVYLRLAASLGGRNRGAAGLDGREPEAADPDGHRASDLDGRKREAASLDGREPEAADPDGHRASDLDGRKREAASLDGREPEAADPDGHGASDLDGRKREAASLDDRNPESTSLSGRHRWAAVLTLLALLLVLVAPATAFMGLVVSQAVDISQAAATWVRGNMALIESVEARLLEVPVVGEFLPDRERIVGLAGQLAQSAGGVLVNSLRAATLGTTNFLFQLFLMLYAMYFFLTGGPAILNRILHLMPLSSDDEHQLLDRFVSVTRATIKGSLVIGAVQGSLAGLSFFVFGVPGAAFWGTVMTVLSIVPALGTALVWVPAVVWLLATGQIAAGISVGLWCGLVVGTVDNFLRPRLVGRDAKLPDLLILLSTFGGILFFGAVGFILGPIVAALFVTVWEIFAVAYRDVLPEVRPRSRQGS